MPGQPERMLSRERTLAAINHQEPDRIPVFFRGIAPLRHLWKDEHERVDVLLKMGADEKVTIGIKPRIHPDVTVRDWFDETSDPRYRLAYRDYNTPKGVLRTIMRCTEDCPYDDGIPLISNYNISRGVEFLAKVQGDLPKLAYLLQEPAKEDIANFREQARREEEFAALRGVLVEGIGGSGGAVAAWLSGMDRLAYCVYDDIDFVEELLDLIYKVELKCLEIVLDRGVDTVYVDGCYETAPLWSPQWFDRLFAPRLEKKTRLVHQAGAKFSYFSTGDFVPHLDVLLRIGVDIINSIRPFPGGINDMHLLKRKIGHRTCLWGGINPEEVIERGTQDDVRRAVAGVILKAAAGGGLVISAAGSIYDLNCYDNVMALIRTVHELGSYPIDTNALEVELKHMEPYHHSQERRYA